jgi:hypothetical protein
MKKSFILTAIAAAITLTACNENEGIAGQGDGTNPGGENNDPIVVNLTSNISPKSTRLANDQWQENDAVGVSVGITGETDAKGNRVFYTENARFQASADGQLTGPTVLYPADTSKVVDIIAYYPYNNNPWISTYSETTGTYSSYMGINVYAGEQQSGLAQEILFSNNIKNQAPTAAPVALNFKYSLAKIAVTVTASGTSGLTQSDFEAMSVFFKGIDTRGVLSLTSGTISPNSSADGGTSYAETCGMRKTGSTTNSATFEALVMPNSATKPATFEFNFNGQVFQKSTTDVFEAGKVYNMSFNLDITKADAVLINTTIETREPVSKSYTVN